MQQGEADVTVTTAHGLSAQVAEWASAFRLEDAPDEVLHAGRRLVLDGFGCSLFGTTVPWTQPVLDLVASSGSGEEATVWGRGQRVPVLQAPLANGTTMHAFESDDLHPSAALHGASQAVPAAMAIAELRSRGPAAGERPSWLPDEPVGEREFLAAMLVGLEVGAAIGLATGSPQLMRGFHPSPNTGTLSAAVTAARLLRFDADLTLHALGIAGSFGGYLMAAQYGAAVKRVHPGRASQGGTTAALLAARGLTGIQQVLEAPYGGFGHAFAGIGVDELSPIMEGLGTTWETPRFTIKAYPCCGSNHTAIDALLAMRAEHPFEVGAVQDIVVRCSTITADHVGWPYAADSVTAAQMNLSYTLAALLEDGEVTVDQYRPERIARPSTVTLADSVRIEVDPAIDTLGRDLRHTVEVEIELADGARLVRRVEHARGSAHHPLSDDEVLAKFQRQANGAIGADAANELAEMTMDLAADDRPGRVMHIAELLGGRQRTN